MKKRKTWSEKLDDAKDLPRIFRIDPEKAQRWGSGTCVIPAPREVDALMRRVPEGKLITISELRTALAKKHQTDIACPITTGIFAWIAANAAAEKGDATPYWRTLKTGGELNPKYPGGIAAVRARLEAEGHRVIAKGKRWFVADYERALIR